MIFPKKILTAILLVLICAVVIYFVFLTKNTESSSDDTSQNSTQQTQDRESMPLLVKVSKAKKSDLILTLRSPGEAVTDKLIVVKAEVSSVINKLNVEEGKHVQKGEVLIELDDREFSLDLEKREAVRLKVLSELFLEKRFAEPNEDLSTSETDKINMALKDYERARQLYDRGLISKKEFEKNQRQYEFILIEVGGKTEEIRETNLIQADVDLKKSQMQLEKTKIKAPFSGIITDIQVSPFEHVTSGRELFTLVNIDRIKVEARVLESEIGKMKIDRSVDLTFSAYPERVFKGKVKAISPIVNPADKTCKVFIDVANPNEEIKPGMHTQVEIAAEIHRNRLLIPQLAVLVRGGRKLAFVVDNGLAKWRYIEVGLENEDYAEVLDGIKEGETVIIDGHFTLAHDARVKIEK